MKTSLINDSFNAAVVRALTHGKKSDKDRRAAVPAPRLIIFAPTTTTTFLTNQIARCALVVVCHAIVPATQDVPEILLSHCICVISLFMLL